MQNMEVITNLPKCKSLMANCIFTLFPSVYQDGEVSRRSVLRGCPYLLIFCLWSFLLAGSFKSNLLPSVYLAQGTDLLVQLNWFLPCYLPFHQTVSFYYCNMMFCEVALGYLWLGANLRSYILVSWDLAVRTIALYMAVQLVQSFAEGKKKTITKNLRVQSRGTLEPLAQVQRCCRSAIFCTFAPLQEIGGQGLDIHWSLESESNATAPAEWWVPVSQIRPEMPNTF